MAVDIEGGSRLCAGVVGTMNRRTEVSSRRVCNAVVKQCVLFSAGAVLLAGCAEPTHPLAGIPDIVQADFTSAISASVVDIHAHIQELQVISLCEEIGGKLGSVSISDCLAQNLIHGGQHSVNFRPLVVREFRPGDDQQAAPKVLILGGIHGDEYSSISIMFHWMDLVERDAARSLHWRFMPAVNPDGLLDGEARRQNSNDVDLNRNFPSLDWAGRAETHWRVVTGSNPRRYPGEEPASEPEVRWLMEQIDSFQPDVIVSVHAPYHLLDFDGPTQAPDRIGELYLHQVGVYPGSLGNYAGIDLGIPAVTIELPSAGIMPTDEQVATTWTDLVAWLTERPYFSGERAVGVEE